MASVFDQQQVTNRVAAGPSEYHYVQWKLQRDGAQRRNSEVPIRCEQSSARAKLA